MRVTLNDPEYIARSYQTVKSENSAFFLSITSFPVKVIFPLMVKYVDEILYIMLFLTFYYYAGVYWGLTILVFIGKVKGDTGL